MKTSKAEFEKVKDHLETHFPTPHQLDESLKPALKQYLKEVSDAREKRDAVRLIHYAPVRSR